MSRIRELLNELKVPNQYIESIEKCMETETPFEIDMNIKWLEFILKSKEILPDLIGLYPFKNVLSVEWVRFLNEEIAKINRTELENITWLEKGQVVRFPQEMIDGFAFTGLSNKDFILSDFRQQWIDKQAKSE